jgi:hypothetical protein
VAFVLWKHRAEIAAAGQDPAAASSSETSTPADTTPADPATAPTDGDRP